MKLLRVIQSFAAATGGPAAGIRAISPVLAALGHTTTVASADAPGTVAPEPGLDHVALGPQRWANGYAAGWRPWLRAHAASFDAVIVHGLWQYPGYAVWRALRGTAIPYFVYPHGMLDPWFHRTYPLKHCKKQLYWWLAEHRILRGAAAVLFTCEEERRLAHGVFHPYRLRPRVVNYGCAAPPDHPAEQRAALQQRCPELAAQRFILFLGRIHEKKGVDLLLRAYGSLARSSARTGIEPAAWPALVIAGPCAEPDYLRGVQRLAAELDPPARVVWPGMIAGDAKWGAFRAADAFVLPSHQENFGIAVTEALACATPVLITRPVNIWREIEQDGAGLVDDDTSAGVERLLRGWFALDAGSRSAMRGRAQRCFHERFEISRAASSLVREIESARSGVRAS